MPLMQPVARSPADASWQPSLRGVQTLQQSCSHLLGRSSLRQHSMLGAHRQVGTSTRPASLQNAELEARGPEQGVEGEDEPWTLTQFVSLISGFLGSLLSVNAYSQLREKSKGIRRSSGSSKPRTKSSSRNVVQQLGGSLLEAEAEVPLFFLGPVPPSTPESTLRSPDRHVTIITTASLPWRTGTAVNPLLRALYLAKSGRATVLVLPFMEASDQARLFPPGMIFETPQEQEKVVRDWCRERANINSSRLPLEFRWYPAKYVESVCSIFPTGDPSTILGEGDPKDVLIMEEPEHLCWYHHGQRWPSLFKHVIGIIHTNYADYMEVGKEKQGGSVPLGVKEASVFVSSTLVCSAYCDVNIKLSDTIMPLPNEVTCNVHGVREEFLQIGDKQRSAQSEGVPVYFLGKALMEKGWRELLQLFGEAGTELSELVVDGYGSGLDFDNIVTQAQSIREKGGVNLRMNPGVDHADKRIHGYGVLVNPSTSDVLCTVTAEALAMGKQCVLARHVSNEFFEQFTDRCHFFQVGDARSFLIALRTALAAGHPSPLPPEQRRILTWEGANDRLFECAEIRVLSGPLKRPSEGPASRLAYRVHYDIFSEDSNLSDAIKRATLGVQESHEAIPTGTDRALSELEKQWQRSKGHLRKLRRDVARFRDQLSDRTDDFLNLGSKPP